MSSRTMAPCWQTLLVQPESPPTPFAGKGEMFGRRPASRSWCVTRNPEGRCLRKHGGNAAHLNADSSFALLV